ncbi:MAG: hypothetical protein IPL15_20655 [Comamonadaceae bacterium]|jgi:hypothetical protein|uniref:hypothetical protein n=1 Tax=Candidatus Skiveiella danica TaxID=3386177 RepID=UPI00390B03AB|nr:hypothetical protein [Comamonadaceae bacterium]
MQRRHWKGVAAWLYCKVKENQLKRTPATAQKMGPVADGPQPKKAIVTALKKFMAARDRKIEKQSSEGDHLALFEKARSLALRLADPNEVAVCIGELNQEAVAHAHKHYEKLKECKAFWYGAKGLEWLAYKKGMVPAEWSEYQEFMDEAAYRAFLDLPPEEFSEDWVEQHVSEIYNAHVTGKTWKEGTFGYLLALHKSRELAESQVCMPVVSADSLLEGKTV